MPDFKIEGLDEFYEKLKSVEKKAPDRILNELDSQGLKLRRETRNNTPVSNKKKPNDKRIKYNYKLNPVEKRGRDYLKGMHNAAPHFHLVNNGHRKVKSNGEEIGWTDGLFMVEKTVAQIEDSMTRELREWLDSLFEELK